MDSTSATRVVHATAPRDRRAALDLIVEVAHEMRTPLAPIITAARLLEKRAAVDERLRKPLATILRQALQLSSMVEDLLDVGAIATGKMRLARHPADLAAIVRRALETCAPSIEEAQHTVTVSDAAQPVRVDVDELKIVQVLCNVLSNAAKYMGHGGCIHVLVGARDGMGVVSIRDEGDGMPPDVLQHVFDRFFQADASASRTRPGLGIGLAVAKAIVDLHGGSIEAESDGLGTGSTFTIRLPLAASSDV